MALDYNCIDLCNNTPALAAKVNFSTAKSQGVKYAIFRSIRMGLVTDESFETYYKNAVAAGIKVGVYLYSYAGYNSSTKKWSSSTAVAYAKKEANALVKLLNGRQLDLPVFYDLESRDQAAALKKTTISQIALAFKEIVEKAGYTFGIYCDADYYKSYIDTSKFSTVPFWIAKYSSSKPTGIINFIGWQYKGTVTGAGLPSGLKCDRSHWYGLSTSTTSTTTSSSSSTSYTEKSCDIYGTISNCNALNIRKGPGTSYNSVGTYSANEIVHLTAKAYDKNGKELGWAKTNKGWISYKNYFTAAIGTVKVICAQLNIRSSDSTAGKVVYTAKKGESFTVVSQSKTGWYRLASGYYCTNVAKYVTFTKL